MIKKLCISAIMLVILTLNLIMPVFADNEINITGIRTPGLALYSDNTDIFTVNNAMPGQKWTTRINISNTTSDILVLSLSEIKNKTPDSKLPPYMYLKISTDDEILYDGTYPIGLNPIISHIEIEPKSTKVLYARCGIMPITGNDIQNENLKTTWVFDGDLEYISTASSTEHKSSSKNPIAIPTMLNGQGGFDVYCYDDNGILLLKVNNIRANYDLVIEAPKISGYEADVPFLSAWNVLNNSVKFTYHKKVNEYVNNGAENENQSLDYDKITKINSKTIEIESNISREGYIVEPNEKSKNRYNDESEYSEKLIDYTREKENQYKNNNENVDDNKKGIQKNDNIFPDVQELIRRILPNTELVIWWIFVLIILVILFTILICRHIQKRKKK